MSILTLCYGQADPDEMRDAVRELAIRAIVATDADHEGWGPAAALLARALGELAELADDDDAPETITGDDARDLFSATWRAAYRERTGCSAEYADESYCAWEAADACRNGLDAETIKMAARALAERDAIALGEMRSMAAARKGV